jgi:IS1 family transposase
VGILKKMTGKIETIFIIESLQKGDLKTGSEIYYDTLEKHYKYNPELENKLDIRLFTIANKTDFFELLNYIKFNIDYFKFGMLLHFEMHGGKLSGLELESGENVEWEELTEFLNFTNLKSRNQLFICMATCYGRSLYKSMNIRETSPFSGYISANKEISAQEILDDYKIIYENLLETHNIVKAYNNLESKNPNSNFYYKDTDSVFTDLMNFTFERIETNESLKNEMIKNIEEELKSNDIEFSKVEIKEALKYTKENYIKYHYPKFTLKNIR